MEIHLFTGESKDWLNLIAFHCNAMVWMWNILWHLPSLPPTWSETRPRLRATENIMKIYNVCRVVVNVKCVFYLLNHHWGKIILRERGDYREREDGSGVQSGHDDVRALSVPRHHNNTSSSSTAQRTARSGGQIRRQSAQNQATSTSANDLIRHLFNWKIVCRINKAGITDGQPRSEVVIHFKSLQIFLIGFLTSTWKDSLARYSPMDQ